MRIACSLLLLAFAGCCANQCKTEITTQTKPPTQPTLCTIEEHFFECIGEDGVIPAMDCVTYDFDGDYDVDIHDFWNLANRTFPNGNCRIDFHAFECWGAHEDCVSEDCLQYDYDGDCDVDLSDLAKILCESCRN